MVEWDQEPRYLSGIPHNVQGVWKDEFGFVVVTMRIIVGLEWNGWMRSRALICTC